MAFPSRLSSRLPASLSLRARLTLRLLGLLALLLAIGAAALLALDRADRRSGGLVADALTPVAEVGRVQNDYADSLNALTHAAMTRLPSAVDEAKNQVQANRADIERHWKLLAASGLGRAQAQLMKGAEAHRKAAEESMAQSIQLLDAGNFDIAQLQVSSDLQSSFVPLHADFSNLFEQALKAGGEVVASGHAASRAALAGLLVLILAGVVAAAVLDTLLIRSITRRLGGAIAVAQRIAAGELGQAIELDGADEIGALRRALQQMDKALGAVVDEVRHGAQAVHAAADRLAVDNAALNQRTQAQAAGLQETAASMAQMTRAVQFSADSALRVDELARGAREQAEQGGRIVAEAVASMARIDASSAQLAGLVGEINGIAFQTRLLALNATVEAAHAGDHGRGFAVVADEVRQLAQRCATAAREARRLIEESGTSIRGGAELVDHSGRMLAQIVDSVGKVSAAVADISASSRAQSADIGQVGQAVAQIDEVTQQNAVLVEQAAASGQALRAQADELLRQIGFFRVASAADPDAEAGEADGTADRDDADAGEPAFAS
jgi:methyl-accepting chemotaxis protein